MFLETCDSRSCFPKRENKTPGAFVVAKYTWKGLARVGWAVVEDWYVVMFAYLVVTVPLGETARNLRRSRGVELVLSEIAKNAS